MRNIGSSVRLFATASALLLVSGPALAGKKDRAQEAIAQAQGKIDAAHKMKVGDTNPAAIARAEASLRMAQERLKSGHKEAAIQAAIESQQFADTAIGHSQARAQADAQMQASSAAEAQQDAAAANARAAAAEQAAASAASDAQAARAAAAVPVVVPAPAPAATTVTTETVKTVPATVVHRAVPVKRKVVRKTTHPARATVVEKTTTTVTNR